MDLVVVVIVLPDALIRVPRFSKRSIDKCDIVAYQYNHIPLLVLELEQNELFMLARAT